MNCNSPKEVNHLNQH